MISCTIKVSLERLLILRRGAAAFLTSHELNLRLGSHMTPRLLSFPPIGIAASSPPASVLRPPVASATEALWSRGAGFVLQARRMSSQVRMALAWSCLEVFMGPISPHADAKRPRSSRLNLNKCRQNLLLRSKVMPKTEECAWEQNYSNVTCTHGARKLPRITIDLCFFFTGTKNFAPGVTFDPQ